MSSDQYATAAETASVMSRPATADEKWLESQLDHIDPHRHEMGAAGNVLAMEKLVLELRGKALGNNLPNWIQYDAPSRILTIHGRKYSELMFGKDGFLSPTGTFFEIIYGPDDVVTMAVKVDLAHTFRDGVLEGRLRERNDLASPMTDMQAFDVRGKLATLKCWHRLSEEEAADLVNFFSLAVRCNQAILDEVEARR